MKKLKYIIVSIFSNIFSKKMKFQAGLVLTFDDDYIENWTKADQILSEFDWKATFYIRHFNRLNANEISQLHNLQQNNHEIGAHGLNHLNINKYLKTNSLENYIKEEISTQQDLMKIHNFYPNSFAYPYGARNSKSDKALLKIYKTLRATTYRNINPKYQNCFFTKKNVIYGLGIDSNYKHFSIAYYLKLLEYAKENHKILILYGHDIVTKSTDNFQTEINTLQRICTFAKQNNMKFYTASELYDL